MEFALKDLKKISERTYEDIQGDKAFYSPGAQVYIWGFFLMFTYLKSWASSKRKWLYLSKSICDWIIFITLLNSLYIRLQAT